MSVEFRHDWQDEGLIISNVNAYTLMSAIGFDDFDYCGEFDVAELPVVIRGCLRVINSVRQAEVGARPYLQEGNFIDFGCDAEEIQRLAQRLLALVQEAQRLESPVYWS